MLPGSKYNSINSHHTFWSLVILNYIENSWKFRTHVTVGTKLWSILLPHLSETERCYRCQQGKLLPTAIVSTKMGELRVPYLGMSEGQKKSRAKSCKFGDLVWRFRLLRQLRRLHISAVSCDCDFGNQKFEAPKPCSIFQQHLRLYLTWFNLFLPLQLWQLKPLLGHPSQMLGPWCTGSCNRIRFAQTSCISGVVVGMMLDDGCQSAWVRSYSMFIMSGSRWKTFSMLLLKAGHIVRCFEIL